MAAFQPGAFQPTSFQSDSATGFDAIENIDGISNWDGTEAPASSGGALFRYIEAQLAAVEPPDRCRISATVIATAALAVTEPPDVAVISAAVWNGIGLALVEPGDSCRMTGENLTPLEVKRRKIKAADDAIISAWLLAA